MMNLTLNTFSLANVAVAVAAPAAPAAAVPAAPPDAAPAAGAQPAAPNALLFSQWLGLGEAADPALPEAGLARAATDGASAAHDDTAPADGATDSAPAAAAPDQAALPVSVDGALLAAMAPQFIPSMPAAPRLAGAAAPAAATMLAAAGATNPAPAATPARATQAGSAAMLTAAAAPGQDRFGAAPAPAAPAMPAVTAATFAAPPAAASEAARRPAATNASTNAAANATPSALAATDAAGAGADAAVAPAAARNLTPAGWGVSAPAANAAALGSADTVTLSGPPTAWRQTLHEALGERLQLQVGKNAEQAVIRLDPPLLGRVEIAIRHSAGALEVTISATNSEVLRQLHSVSDSLRNDLAQRQFSEVAVTVSAAPRGQGAAPFADQQGRGRQQQPEQQELTPGMALAEAGNTTSSFSLTGRE